MPPLYKRHIENAENLINAGVFNQINTVITFSMAA